MCKKLRENDSQNKHEYEKEDEEIDDQSAGVIGAFVNDKLRTIDRNCDFQEIHQEDTSRIVFAEDIKKSIVRNGVIATTDACVKDVNMEGVWKIEEFCECWSTSNITWFRDWMKSTALKTEEAISLDLVETVEFHMRGYDEGKIKTYMQTVSKRVNC